MRMSHSPALLLLPVVLTGCFHTEVMLPGVLDVRSDGSSATANAALMKPVPDVTTRTGVSGIIYGDGATSTAAAVKVEDRQWFVLALVPVLNDMGAVELKAAIGDGALRKTVVGDGMTGLEAGVAVGLTCVSWIPVVNIISLANLLPRISVHAQGERIGGSAATEPPPPTGDALPPLAPEVVIPSTLPPAVTPPAVAPPGVTPPVKTPPAVTPAPLAKDAPKKTASPK